MRIALFRDSIGLQVDYRWITGGFRLFGGLKLD